MPEPTSEALRKKLRLMGYAGNFFTLIGCLVVLYAYSMPLGIGLFLIATGIELSLSRAIHDTALILGEELEKINQSQASNQS